MGWFRSRSQQVLLDEGGVRCRHEGITEYVPFGDIREATTASTLFGSARLRIATRQNEVIADVPSGLDAMDLLARIFTRREAAWRTANTTGRARGDLATWVSTIAARRELDRSGAFYRSACVDFDLLTSTFVDRDDAIEARAAAALALLSQGREDLVMPHVSELTPPLVIATIRFAPKGEALVGHLLDDILPFLALRDRIVFTQRLRAA